MWRFSRDTDTLGKGRSSVLLKIKIEGIFRYKINPLNEDEPVKLSKKPTTINWNVV